MVADWGETTATTGLFKCAAGKAMDTASPVPLKALRATVEVIDFCSEVCLVQEYENSEDETIEAVFCFPISSKAAVTGFVVTNGTKRLVGEVQRARTANTAYVRAIEAGQTAVLVQELGQDLMQCFVGNIAPHSHITIAITFVTELETEEDALRFRLPLTHIPRFNAGRRAVGAPLVSQEESTFALEFTAHFSMSQPLESVTSFTHDISVDMEDNGMHGSVSLCDAAKIDGDLDLLFSLRASADQTREPMVVLEKHPTHGSKAALISFFPEIEKNMQRTEIILLVDRSGSMRGSRIELAKEALQIFLRSLPENCLFNIVGFGTTHKRLFKDSSVYNEKTLATATGHVDSIRADLGGTNILDPLKTICRRPRHTSAALRSLIVLTDGAVSNTSSLLEYVDKRKADTRIFTLGIGSGCSSALVNGLAERSHGAAEFVIEGEPISPKVIAQLKRSMEHGLTDIGASWDGLNIIHSAGGRAIFRGERLLLYGIQATGMAVVDPREMDKESDEEAGPDHQGVATVTISANSSSGGTVRFVVPLHFSDEVAMSGDLIHRLAVKTVVKEDSLSRQSSEHLCLTYGVSSPQCSFVVVDPESPGEVRSKTVTVATPQPLDNLKEGKKKKKSSSPVFKSWGVSSRGASRPQGRGRACRHGSRTRDTSMEIGAPMNMSRSCEAAQQQQHSMQLEDSMELEESRRESHEKTKKPSGARFACMAPPQALASSSSSKGAPPAPSNSLVTIIRSQAFNGSWSLSYAAGLLNKSVDNIKANVAKSSLSDTVKGNDTLIGTALVVAFLRRTFRSKAVEWDLVVAKAEKWIVAAAGVASARALVQTISAAA